MVRTSTCLGAAAVALFSLVQCVIAVNNGVGRVPALGYNSWNDFRCNDITAANIMKVADAFISLGLDKVGYEYVNIDDCWATSRDPTTHVLIPDPTAFPDGMKAVADYVHSKGLKFGIYTDRGTKTCAGRPASGGYMTIDAQTFASWGVDYLKCDSCNASQNHTIAFEEYGELRDALNATGREIYYSLCGWNSWYAPVGQSLGNSWRIAGDCNAWPSVYNAIRTNEVLASYAGPGGWNDPDMLVGSTPGAAVHNTEDQARTQFSLWSIMAAPLLIGSDILNMSSYDLATYTNTEVLAIDQDPKGVQGVPIVNTCPSTTLEELSEPATSVPDCWQIWSRPLADGSAGVVFVNFGSSAVNIQCDATCMSKVGFSSADVRDLWAHKNLGTFSVFNALIKPDGASMTFKFSKPSTGVSHVEAQ